MNRSLRRFIKPNALIEREALIEEEIERIQQLDEVDAPYAFGLLLALTLAGASVFGGGSSTPSTKFNAPVNPARSGMIAGKNIAQKSNNVDNKLDTAINKLQKNKQDVIANDEIPDLNEFVNDWLGTDYDYGGSTRKGIDCSAYARQLYKDVFNVDLPRDTANQINVGEKIPSDGSDLRIGDLFFYIDKKTNKTKHVVIYMGNNKFTHSTSGRGVVIDGPEAIQPTKYRDIQARRVF